MGSCAGSNSSPGYDGELLLSKDGGLTFVRFAEIKDMELTINNELFDATNHDTKGWQASVDGLKNWEVTGDANFVNADVGQAVVREALLGKTVLQVKFRPKVAATIIEFSGCGFVRTTGYGSPSDDLTGFSFEIQGTGELFMGVQAA